MLVLAPPSKSARKVTQNSNTRMAGKGYFKIQETRMCCRHFKEKKTPHKSPSVICTFTAPFKSPCCSASQPRCEVRYPIKPISSSLILNSPRSGALHPAYFALNVQLHPSLSQWKSRYSTVTGDKSNTLRQKADEISSLPSGSGLQRAKLFTSKEWELNLKVLIYSIWKLEQLNNTMAMIGSTQVKYSMYSTDAN